MARSQKPETIDQRLSHRMGILIKRIPRSLQTGSNGLFWKIFSPHFLCIDENGGTWHRQPDFLCVGAPLIEIECPLDTASKRLGGGDNLNLHPLLTPALPVRLSARPRAGLPCRFASRQGRGQAGLPSREGNCKAKWALLKFFISSFFSQPFFLTSNSYLLVSCVLRVTS